MLARLGAWMSFRTAAGLVEELFPLASGGSTSTVRRRVLAEAARVDAQRSTGRAEPAAAARSIDVGVDTTYVRSCAVDGPRHHEVLIGIAMADDGRSRRLGGVIATLDPPHELIAGALQQLGRDTDTTITAYTDGAEMLRRWLAKAGVPGRPILDWAHLARRMHATKTTAKGLQVLTEREYRARPAIRRLLDSVHWRLWNGQVGRARDALVQIERRLEAFDARRQRPGRPAIPARRVRTAVNNLRDYVDGQSAYLVDYARRQRAGQQVGTSPVESLANALVNKRMNKLQQMRWSVTGAHAVVTVRADAMNTGRRAGATATALAA